MDNFRDSYFNVTWDLTKKHLRGTFWGKQYDTGRGFAVTIVEGGQVTVPSTETVRLKWEKPDSTEGYVTAVVVGDKFLIEGIDQMFTVHGAVRSDLEIWRGGKVISSITFYVSVEKAVAVDAIESSSQFTALQEALSEVGDMQAQVDAVIANATVDSEVILARGTEPTLGSRLDADKADIDGRIDTLITTPVPAEKTDFLSISTNLIDKSKLIFNKSIAKGTGALMDNPSLDLIEYQPCEPNTTYTCSGLYRVAYNTAEKAIISTQDLNINAVLSFTTPSNCYYISYAVSKLYTNVAQLNVGSTLLEYEPYYITVEKLKGNIKNNNRVYNSDFSKGTSGWLPTYATLSTSGATLQVTGDGAGVYTDVRSATDVKFKGVENKMYCRAKVKVNSANVSYIVLRVTGSTSGTSFVLHRIDNPIPDTYYDLSGISWWTDQVGNVTFDIYTSYVDSTSALNSVTVLEKPFAISLTEFFGSGKEPTLEEFNSLLNTFPDEWNSDDINGVLMKNVIDVQNLKNTPLTREYTLEFETVEIPGAIGTFTSKRLSLIGTKKDNYYNALNPPIQQPNTVGYLYLDVSTNKLYYSAGKYDAPVYLCDWNTTIAGGTNCIDWIPIITKDGDIIFLKATTQDRYQPIMYPAGDYSNPILINTTEEYPPTGLTTDTGFCVSCHGDFFIFGEYKAAGDTDGNGEPVRIWKVEKPYSNPSNWRVVDTWYYSNTGAPWGQNPDREITHFHTVAFDHFSGYWYANTGDDNPNCRVIESTDDGETWSEVISGGQRWRTLGYIFTEDACYWGTDSDTTEHKLYKAPRDLNGKIDFANTEVLAQLSLSGQRTYNTCLIREPYGLLLLDRAEPRYDGMLDVEFWSFDDNKLYNLGEYENYYPVPTDHPRYGFGNIAVTYYQPTQEDGIISGGGGGVRHMSMAVLNNVMNNTLGVVKLKVIIK